MELNVFRIDGELSGDSVALPNEVFDVEPNDHLIYQAIRSQMTNNRQGTVATKKKRQARQSAYAYKAKQAEVMLVEDFKLENPKTKEMYQILKNLNVEDKKVLLLTTDYDPIIARAGRNIPNLIIRQASDASTYDIVHCDMLLIQQNALDKITEVCTA